MKEYIVILLTIGFTISINADTNLVNFKFTLVFDDNVPSKYIQYSEDAAKTWENIILSIRPIVIAENYHERKLQPYSDWSCDESIDDYLGTKQNGIIVFIEQDNSISSSARANTCYHYERGSNNQVLPVAGWIKINTNRNPSPTLIMHEFGHVLGINERVTSHGYCNRPYGNGDRFGGHNVKKQLAQLSAKRVHGDDWSDNWYVSTNTRFMRDHCAHWDRDVDLEFDVMSRIVWHGKSIIGVATAAYLMDIGYRIDWSQIPKEYPICDPLAGDDNCPAESRVMESCGSH